MAKPPEEKSETIDAIMERARQFLNQLNGGPPADGTPAASPTPATSGPDLGPGSAAGKVGNCAGARERSA